VAKKRSDRPPEPMLASYPFGPLLGYWMRHGIGLLDGTGSPRWQDKVLQSEMVATGHIADLPTSLSPSFRNWKNGHAFPNKANWQALRSALTRHIAPASKGSWDQLIFEAWEKAAPLGREERKQLYQESKIASGSVSPIMTYLQEQFEEEVVLADASAIQRLHNRAPHLLSAIQQAILDRRAGRIDAALQSLSDALSEHHPVVEESVLRMEAQADMFRQRANVLLLKGDFDNAIGDLARARNLIPFERQDDIRSLTTALWSAIGRKLVWIGDLQDGREYLGVQQQRYGQANLLAQTVLLGLAGDYAEGKAAFDRMVEAAKTDAKLTPDVITWNTLLGLAGDYAEGKAVFDRMVEAAKTDAKLTPNVITWSTLLGLAGDYAEGKAVFDRMVEAAKTDAKLTPNVITWNTLLGLAGDYAEGKAVFDRMVEAGITPGEFETTSLAKLANTAEQCISLAKFAKSMGLAGSGFFGSLLTRLHPHLDAEELLGWAFGFAKEHGFFFPLIAFEPAISGYRKARRFDDALRIVLPFPHLPSAQALLRDQTLQTYAEARFTNWYETGFEPHNASNALTQLYVLMGQSAQVVKWAEIALRYPEQHAKRQEALRSMLRKHRSQ
jgi:pentatricopeptide repeat protein